MRRKYTTTNDINLKSIYDQISNLEQPNEIQIIPVYKQFRCVQFGSQKSYKNIFRETFREIYTCKYLELISINLF